MERRIGWVATGILLLLTALFFWKLAFSDLILARGDTYHYFYPYWDARSEAFRAGELPLWTNDIFMGAPLLANPQLGTFYPPNWIVTPFAAPDAIRYSILLHILWAGLGTFLLFRVTVDRRLWPGLLAAALFALGGFVGAHVEQINQLQGLAWMPWLVLCLHHLLHGGRRLRWGLLLAMAWALQLFSGHTQTVFMSGVMLGLYALSAGVTADESRLRRTAFALGMLLSAALLTALLALPQLLPTLELTGMSIRGGGFTPQQATAFSLPPTYLGRSLLPSYDGQLFGEYVGYIGVIGLGLALLGSLPFPHMPWRKSALPWVLLALIGLLFALGRFNPLYLFLTNLPGFDLFRVPARWLALFALGAALLAGRGLVLLQLRVALRLGHYAVIVLPLLALLVLGAFAPIDPLDVVGSAMPTSTTLLLWGVGLVVLIMVLWMQQPARYIVPLQLIVFGLVIVELFFAARVLPYNDLAPREVYLGQRLTISQLLALQEDEMVPGRTLSISQLYFDPGDLRTLLERYERLGMGERAVQNALTAVKKQEVLFPSLGLTWGIPTVDGYGGGVLPTMHYSQYTSLLLPEGSLRTADGRIGEMMALPECRGACIPDLRWLWFADIEYILTDKVFDVVHQGVRYDTTLQNFWDVNPYPIPDTDVLNFAYDELRILSLAPLAGYEDRAQMIQEGLVLTVLAPGENYEPSSDPDKMIAATLVDTRTGAFLELQPSRIERTLSSDIKLYRLPLESARAMLVRQLRVLPDDWEGHEEALGLLDANVEFVIHTNNRDVRTMGWHDIPWWGDIITFTEYSPTRVVLEVESEMDTYLVLRDAYYPGWHATVNGEPVPVYRANVLFRAVPVPEGQSTVVFEFVPTMWYGALAAGGVLWLGALLVLGGGLLRKRTRQ